jgi:hypothetical protein
MLDFDRRWSFDTQNQRAGLGVLAGRGALPLDLQRLTAGGDLDASNLTPARHQFGAGEALTAKALADDLAGDVA